ncbi:DNA polymerase III subunit delta [candidate division LCP-89 bacterium B3_LCP]|uniref:DNA polymerase III subunit delta n=1 Tax=candidate division LCP-89 bacterium B3_LCP TaxID=2012998 RepID=A0A532UYK9_UNCL8|nr:MAG: DNA polymerase III subunit delta [candidate division LCP-89 bacterium B3_LCP]
MYAPANTLTYTSFLKRVEGGQIDSTYFLFGPEGVLIDRALERIKEAAIDQSSEDFNWSVFHADADGMDWPLFADALTAIPLIPSRRVVVLKKLNKVLRNKSVIKLIESNVQEPAPDLTLILIEENPDLRNAFFKQLLEKSICVTFPEVKPAELQMHLKDFASGFSKELSDAAIERILTQTNPGLRELLSKMEVLVFYSGDKKTIDLEDVEQCTVFTREVNIYKLLQAIGDRNRIETRDTCEQLLRGKVEIGSLFHMLYRQIWAMFRMKYLQERKVPFGKWQQNLAIWPTFLLNRYRKYLPNYSRGELGRSLEIIEEADRQRKTSAVQDDFILQTLTEKLLQP